MSLSGVNGANPNEEPKRINGTDEQNGQEVKKESEQPCSVWDINKDGTVSVEEQKIAIQNAIDTDETIKEAVELGFVPQYGLSDIVTNKPMFGQTVEYLVDRADNLVKQYINNIKLDATFFINHINMKNLQESIKEMFGNQPAAKDTVNAQESEWHTPDTPHTPGTLMRTVCNDDGSYYEEYKSPNTGRTYINYDAEGKRTGGTRNTIINGEEYPTRKETVDSNGNVHAINIDYDEKGNVIREYGDDDDPTVPNQPAESKETVPKLNSIEEYDQKQKELSSNIKPQAENLDDLENAAKWKQKQIDLANEYGDTVGAEALQADLDRIKQDIERNTSR